MKLRQIILFLFLFVSLNSALYSLTVWEVLSDQIQLDHELAEPAVQTQLRWLLAHPNYLHQLSYSKPYIYHIVTEVSKREMPGELALIPMIESAYNPFAYSVVGAAGLWQIMPATGTDYGLKQDWWYDGRRGISSSTNAALNYLTYLHRYFNGDWLLAIAAYDAGEGAVSRAIKASGQRGKINFWTLPLPAETKAYVPRLLALAEIIRNPSSYNLELPDIPHTPYFEEVEVGSQIDLFHAAKLAGISYKDFRQLNPGFNRWATSPYKSYKLLIPRENLANFMRNLNFATGKTQNPKPRDNFSNYLNFKVTHIVQTSDTIQTLEKKYGVTRDKIYSWNNLDPGNELKAGDTLIIWRNLG